MSCVITQPTWPELEIDQYTKQDVVLYVFMLNRCEYWGVYTCVRTCSLSGVELTETAESIKVQFGSCTPVGPRHGTGSLSHQVNGSFGSSFTPRSSFWRGVRPEFFRFSKKAQDNDIKIYIFVKIRPTVIEVLTFNKWYSKFYSPGACKH